MKLGTKYTFRISNPLVTTLETQLEPSTGLTVNDVVSGLQKYLQGSLTAEERALVESIMATRPNNHQSVDKAILRTRLDLFSATGVYMCDWWVYAPCRDSIRYSTLHSRPY